MKLTVRLLLLVAVLSATQLPASTIDFATDGFFYNTVTNVQVDNPVLFSGSTLKFTGQTGQSANSGGHADLGTFVVYFCCGNGENDFFPDHTGFRLNIYVPGPVDGTPDATNTAAIDGKVNLHADTIAIDFSNPSFSANGANFVLDSTHWELPKIDIVNDDHGSGSVTVQAMVTTPTTVPEPATISLIGFGLLGAALWLRRRNPAA